MRIECICPSCGTAFMKWRSNHDHRFCSRPCAFRGRRRRDPNDRFWAKVDKSGPTLRPDLGPCWVWTASTNVHGYGKFFFGNRLRGAHIVAYILTTGQEPPPETPCVLHACDGGKIGCVRPSHLFVGSQRDNMADMLAKGRECRGEMRAKAKLTYVLAEEIRRRYAGGGTSHQRLANEYGVTRTAIAQVLYGMTWKRA